MADFLRAPPSPRLPDPENDYNPRFMAALLQTLRLYFTQVSNALTALLGNNGAASLQSPYGVFAALSDQTIASTTTAYPVTLGTTLAGSGFSVVSGSRVAATISGVYSVGSTVQLANTDTTARQASVWLRVNGVDVAGSRADFSVPSSHGSFNGAIAGEVVRVLTLTAGDYVEVVWCAESTLVRLAALAAATSPTRPAAPAALVKVTHVSIS